MNILIFGLGALGTTFATLLKKSGHRVHAITKEKYLSAITDNRVRICGIWGEHNAGLDGIYADPAELLPEKLDLIIITVKSYDTNTAIAQIAPIANAHTIVVSAQNGYGNYEAVSKEFGNDHTLLARIIFGAKILQPGYAEVTVIADDVRIGQPEMGVPEEKIIEIASAMNKSGIPTTYAADVNEILWDKILYNCALNPLGALLECNYGKLAANEDTRIIMNAIIREIFETAKAHSIKLHWDAPEQYMDIFYQKLIPPTKDHYPSMYHDLMAGKKLEIDALNGAIVRLAEETGAQVPVNRSITALIKAKEALSFRN